MNSSSAVLKYAHCHDTMWQALMDFHQAKVVFEPCLCHFEYGSDRIQVSTVSRAQGGGAFFSVKKSTADLLSDEVSLPGC